MITKGDCVRWKRLAEANSPEADWKVSQEEIPIWHRKKAFGCEFFVNHARLAEFESLLSCGPDVVKPKFDYVDLTSGESVF